MLPKRFETTSTGIPTYWVGPLKIQGMHAYGNFIVPLATLEAPLAPCVNRGAKATRENGITTLLQDYGWSRAPLLRTQSAKQMVDIVAFIAAEHEHLKEIANATTQYGSVTSILPQIIGRHLYLRINMLNGDAGGHNMTTKGSQAIVDELLKQFDNLELIAISGNYCTDKKVSAANSILGRGKKVIAETTISRNNCKNVLKTTPEAIVNVHANKNLEGSIAAGSICSANAHYANMIAALYLATGQDIANLVESSQGITQAELNKDGSLYFSVTIPNIIVGTVKSKGFPQDQKKTLEILGCYGTGSPVGSNAKKLAEIIGATTLAGELNLLAVLSKDKELIESHERIEREKQPLAKTTQKPI